MWVFGGFPFKFELWLLGNGFRSRFSVDGPQKTLSFDALIEISVTSLRKICKFNNLHLFYIVLILNIFIPILKFSCMNKKLNVFKMNKMQYMFDNLTFKLYAFMDNSLFKFCKGDL